MRWIWRVFQAQLQQASTGLRRVIYIRGMRWIEEQKDTLLHLELVERAEAVTLASDIRSWCLSSPEIRERQRTFGAMLVGEEKASGWVDPE